MLGRTHVVTSTAMGSLGLYGMHVISEHTFDTPWLETATRWVFDPLHFPVDGSVSIGSVSVSAWVWWVVCMLALAFGALLPDIDSRRSVLGRYVPFVETVIGHRTITHTVWVMALWLVVGSLVHSIYLWMVIVGYILHIWQDSLSVQGVDVLWPFGKGYRTYASGAVFKRGSHLALYRVGGAVEQGIFIAMLILHLWGIWLWSRVL